MRYSCCLLWSQSRPKIFQNLICWSKMSCLHWVQWVSYFSFCFVIQHSMFGKHSPCMYWSMKRLPFMDCPRKRATKERFCSDASKAGLHRTRWLLATSNPCMHICMYRGRPSWRSHGIRRSNWARGGTHRDRGYNIPTAAPSAPRQSRCIILTHSHAFSETTLL